MSASLLLLAAVTPVLDDDAARLRAIFVNGCVNAQIAGSQVTEVPFEKVGPDFFGKSEGATNNRAFEINEIKGSYLLFAEYSGRRDGAIRRCAVVSSKWSLAEAGIAALADLDGTEGEPLSGVPAKPKAHVIGGGRYSKSFKTNIAYGQMRGKRIVSVVSYDDETARKLTRAMGMLNTCEWDKRKGRPVNCTKEEYQEAAKMIAEHDQL